jgi:hypothetical protein
MTKRTISVIAIAAAGMLAPASATAGDFAPHEYAARTGLSFNPDQFLAGLHFQVGDGRKPQVRPVVDFGFGNGVRLLALSGDVLYHFADGQWRPYGGGGPGVNFIDVTDGVGEADGLQPKIVAHAVAGLTWAPRRSRYGYFVEGRFGIGDTPRVRVSVGMSF